MVSGFIKKTREMVNLEKNKLCSMDRPANLQATYLEIRKEVQEHYSSAWTEVETLCAALPSSIDKQAVWRFGRDKPCYSNIKVFSGQRIASDLKLSTDFDSYQAIAGDDWEIVLKKRGIKWRSNSNFSTSGARVAAYMRSLRRGGLASYVWRLYAIRQLAIALSKNVVIDALVDELSEINGSVSLDATDWAKRFAGEVGLGWGFVTANHLLTDLGLSIKPDLHVRRAAIRMGLMEPLVPKTITCAEIDGLSSKVDEQIVARIKELSLGMTPAASQNPRAILREIDKTLMEWSRERSRRGLMDVPA